MKSLSVLSVSALVVFSALLGPARRASAATDTWTDGGTDAFWSTPGNWTGGNAPPVAGDSLIFGTTSLSSITNDLTALTAFDGLTFNGSAFTLTGNSVLLSGQALGNTIGIANNSGIAQVIGTMPLTLDWGYYTFSSPGTTLALNGGLTLNPGGVAYFDGNSTSSSLVNDSSGLISGLGGAGLIYNGSKFTGLATMNGSAIATYSGWPSVVAAPGAIGATTPGAAVNIELTGTAVGNYTFANGAGITYANTIFLTNASASTLVVGSTGGAQTLDLGAVSGIGGIYLPNGNTAQAVTIGSGAQTTLTAGPETGGATPGTIVFAINGTSSANQASMNSTIKNNLSGGAVTVVKTGPGSMFSGATLTNTYTGGTYILQGQYQGGLSASSFGAGPIYIATNATIYFNNTGNVPNEIFMSQGVGAGAAAATANAGALIAGGSTDEYLSGKIHLLGNAVTVGFGPANRVSTLATSKNMVFTGQITGSGTLETYMGAHSGNVVLANAAQNNNWTGGILVFPKSGLSAYLKLGANNQIPNGPGTGDMWLNNSGQAKDARFDLNGFNTTINALNAPNIGVVGQQELANFGPLGTATVTMGANGNNGTFFGVTQEGGAGTNLAIIKIGSGTQTFNGNAAFAYHGNTTVSNGTFALTGAGQIPNSPVITVKSGATLDGSALSAGGLTVGAAQTLNCVGTVLGNTTINGTVEAFDAIGTLTDTGNLILGSGGTYIWDINKVTGTAGSDPGWSLLNVSGTLDLSSLGASSFTINVVSPTGNATNFNSLNSYSWIIASAAGGITGFTNSTGSTNSSQFAIVTSAFANDPNTSSQWSVSTNAGGNNLLLNFSSFQVITTPLPPAPLVVNQGHTATFTVTANSLGSGTTFAWTQNGNPLSNGGQSAGGAPGNVTINTVGNTSTLTITGVDAVAYADSGPISVTVNMTFNGPQTATSTETLTVIDTPYSPNVTPSFATPPINAGAVDVLTASAGGTQPFTYQWYLGTNILIGQTGSNLTINVSSATVGSYTVVISNPSGSVTSSAYVIPGPVTEVPNQLVYEPFNYDINSPPGGAPWTAFGVTNIYNQATGVGLSWLNSGTAVQPATLPFSGLGAMRVEPGYDNATITPTGDTYPWPGLAGNSPQDLYCNVNSFIRLPLGTGGSISSGKVYFSAVIHVDQGGNIATVGTDYFCGFGNGSSTTPNTAIYIQTPGNDTYIPGIFKTSAGTGSLNPGVNGSWSSQAYHRGQVVFVIARLTINPGANNDTFDLWLAPTNNSFGASEANLPPPDVTGVGSSAADVGSVDFFFVRNTAQPFSRRFADLRIGTTWASVTPPGPPTLSLANVVLPPGVTTAVFASQNAGNPVTTYQWQFNGGSPLSDGPSGNGSSGYSGTATDTLTITNAIIADLGTYTVTGSSTDPLNSYSDPFASPMVSGDRVFNPTATNWIGSASATLTLLSPPLSVARSAPNVILSWPTNWTGYTLENATALSPSQWVTNYPPTYTITGTNYTQAVPAASGTKFFRLIK